MFHEILHLTFQVDGVAVCCSIRTGTASTGECCGLTIDSSSVGTIRVADRDTIIERYKEGVGVSIKRRVQSVMHDGVIKH
jgi:hypothetical protein